MPGQRPILAMSFVASLGITFEILSCTVAQGGRNFWPLIILLFYLILPLPMILSKRIAKETMIGMNDGNESKVRDYSLFLTAGILVSSMALPIVMARTPTSNPLIQPIPCALLEFGNILCIATIALFFIYFKPSHGF